MIDLFPTIFPDYLKLLNISDLIDLLSRDWYFPAGSCSIVLKSLIKSLDNTLVWLNSYSSSFRYKVYIFITFSCVSKHLHVFFKNFLGL